MANRTLIRLEQVSGYAASAGQSFVSNVKPVGAKDGTRMTDYILYGWDSWTNSYSGGTLAYNATINLTYNLNAGSRWSNIRTTLFAQANDGTDPSSYGSIDIVSGALPAPGANSLQLRVRGGTKVVQLHRIFNGVNKQWTEYGTEPNPNPVSMAQEISIGASFTSNGNTTPDTYSYTLHVIYPGDGDFNDLLDYSFPVSVMGNVTTDDSTGAVEWYSNSSYSVLYDAGTQTHVMSGGDGPTSGSLWMRYKDNGAWVNYGQVDWFDPRVYGHF